MVAEFDGSINAAVNRHILCATQIALEDDRLANPLYPVSFNTRVCQTGEQLLQIYLLGGGVGIEVGLR
jgi:hypothetical protein